MAGYAAAMDASMTESPECTRQEAETLSEHGVSDMTDPLEGSCGADWESQTGEESDKASLSLCISETESKKGKGVTSSSFSLTCFSRNTSLGCAFFLSCVNVMVKTLSLSHSLTTSFFLFPLSVISLPCHL